MLAPGSKLELGEGVMLGRDERAPGTSGLDARATSALRRGAKPI